MNFYDKIPNELKQLEQWCLYRLEHDSKVGKYKKIPIDAKTGDFGKSNDESTWVDFNSAQEALIKYNCDGLGFYFKPPYFGVDIDDIESDIRDYLTGNNENIVAEFVNTLESYTEASLSDKGLHIICKGKLPTGGRRKGNIEMYDSGRFFVMTGKAFTNYKKIKDCTEAISFLHSKYIGQSGLDVSKNTLNTTKNDLSLDEILEKIFNSKHKDVFKSLYDGNWSGWYPSQSEADLRFCNLLAFWTGGDAAKMDSIMRSSQLMREKWDQKRGSLTYGEKVINKAIQDCHSYYSPENENDFNLNLSFQDKKKKRYPFDDTGNAERLIDEYGENIRYSYINKCWYYYDDKKWCVDQTGEIKKIVDTLVKEMRKDISYASNEDEEKAIIKHLKSSRSSKGKNAMVKEAEHLVSILPHEFDKDKALFNVQNGVINLKTGKLQSHDKNLMMTKISNVEFTDKIDCPKWIEFLNTIFNYDQDIINYMQKAVGYSLTASTREQCLFVLHGNGRNGKSVFLDIIREIMGGYATNIQPETIMVKQLSAGANSDIARLKAARFVTTSEPNEGVRLNEGLVKQLTGGDQVTARHQYGKEFEFQPEFKLWMATNHKPIIRGTDDGIWRRLHLIPFTVQIPVNKVDKNLKYKLRHELRGILNWATEGCLKWQREGLERPKSVEEASNEYRSEMDVIVSFIEDCCVVDNDKKINSTTLYDAYREWAKNNGQYCMSSTKFGRELGHKFKKNRLTSGNCYIGIGLNQFHISSLPIK